MKETIRRRLLVFPITWILSGFFVFGRKLPPKRRDSLGVVVILTNAWYEMNYMYYVRRHVRSRFVWIFFVQLEQTKYVFRRLIYYTGFCALAKSLIRVCQLVDGIEEGLITRESWECWIFNRMLNYYIENRTGYGWIRWWIYF